MHIEKINIKNFRLLKDISISLEPQLSLVIGKNNVGKTSLLKILKKFLEEGENTKFQFNDFNLDFQNELLSSMDPATPVRSITEYGFMGISMRILIKIDPKDDLGIVSKIALTLDPENYYVALGFDYSLSYEAYLRLRSAIDIFLEKENAKDPTKAPQKDIRWFVEKYYSSYFQLIRKSIYSDKDGNLNEEKFVLLKHITDFRLKDLISFKVIEAKRDVENKDTDKTLSVQISKLYNQIEGTGNKNKEVERLEDELMEMDEKLSDVYKTVFEDIRDIVKEFGGNQPAEMEIKVDSSLAARDLMKGNTVVKYSHNGMELPENFNGLGYMNLLSMLFEIEKIRNEFSNPSGGILAEINLLFIEEPEAHTHPQMQNIFIRNIKKLIAKGIEKKRKDQVIKRPIQYIISSHSPHIVSNCDFDDLKYMLLDGKYSSVKNFKELKDMYGDDRTAFSFVKQYLTIHRCELFFADKAIIIEGDTERILLPAMMQKMDSDFTGDESGLPLLSQNISIIECGAYSQKFIPLLNFIQLHKICIITDIDFCLKELDTDGKEKGRATKKKWDDAHTDRFITSNTALKAYFKKNKVSDLLSLKEDDKIGDIALDDNHLEKNTKGSYRICFQVEENGYKARSFEDAFFHINGHLLKEESKERVWGGLKEESLTKFRSDDPKERIDVYDLIEEGILSKARLASDLLYIIYGGTSSESSKIEWSVPKYIKEGLEWLKKN